MINSKLSSSGIANDYTKQEVQHMFLNLIYNAPESLDTLNELAAALGDDEKLCSMGEGAADLDASIVYVYAGLATKHPLLLPTSELSINKLIVMNIYIYI